MGAAWISEPLRPRCLEDCCLRSRAALGIGSGIYSVVDDEPLRRREYFDALAELLDVPPPKLPPLWVVRLTGWMGETMARSLRLSDRKLRRESGWAPKYPSVRTGYRAVVAQIERAGG